MSVLVVFGAGASYGSEKQIDTPVLSVSLFQVLRTHFPSTWGKLDLKYGNLFCLDFEDAMNQVLAQHPLDICQLQRDMAQYFFKFYPSCDNLYIKMIRRLGIKDIAFISLNYDRLLEEAIHISGFSPNYKLQAKTEKEVNICLPHGCCNFFLEGFDIPPEELSFTYADDIFDSSEISIIRDNNEFQSKINLCALSPIMACFNSEKTAAFGKIFLEAQRKNFEKMVLSAQLIIIIGIQVRDHDEHLWIPLAKTNAKLVYCSGNGAKIFEKWRNKLRIKKKDHILSGYFFEHFEEICNIISSKS